MPAHSREGLGAVGDRAALCLLDGNLSGVAGGERLDVHHHNNQGEAPRPPAPASRSAQRGVARSTAVTIALCDGLMLQWLVDPDATPDAAPAVDALALLAPFLTEES
ncbi:MAG TPA: hypothetical protein VFD59_02570 [Nocardioidaceae bacterium]|nr:hypothetical protein [Nocardioidaceae bacterium]